MTELAERTEALLEQLAGIFRKRVGIEARTGLSDSARRRARAAFESLGRDSCAQSVALLGFATDLIASAADELTRDPSELGCMLDEVEAVDGISRRALGREVLRAPQLLELPEPMAIDVDLALVVAFTRAHAVSLWRTGLEGIPTELASAGDRPADDDQTRRLARRLLTAESANSRPSRSVAGVVIETAEQPRVALIAAGGSSLDRVFLLEAQAPCWD